MPLTKLFGNKRKERTETTVNADPAHLHSSMEDDHYGPMSARAKSPSDILDFSGYPRLEPTYSNKNYTTQQVLPKAKPLSALPLPPAKVDSGSPPLAMPKPKHAVPPAKQVLMGEECDKTEIEGEGRPVYETSTHLPPGRSSASSTGYMGEREDSSELDASPDNITASIRGQQYSDNEGSTGPRSNRVSPWQQQARTSRSSNEDGKGVFAQKKPLLAPQAEPPHTPPTTVAPSSSNVSVKNIASELRPSLQQPLPLVHEEDEDYDVSPIPESSNRNPNATTIEDGSPPTPNSPILTTVVRDDSGSNSAPYPSTSHQASNSQGYSSPAHSYMELVDLRQQMSAIRLEREEWKERENQHRKREQEMLDQINRTQEQLQLALSSGGFLSGGIDPRPHTPEDDLVVLSPASKPNQLGPAMEDGSVSDDREYYSLPPSRTRRERQELSDYADEPSEYSEEELPREYRSRRHRSYHEDDEEDEEGDCYYNPSPRRSSRYYERPRSYEPEYERRRHHHRSYTPTSLDSELSGDYSPELVSSYSRRRDDDDRYDFVDARDRELYSDEEIAEIIVPRSRSRTPSRRSLSRNESLNRNASRSGSRNRSRSASRNESRSGSRSQNRSQAPSRNSSHNLSRRSSSRRHSSHHAPEDYYEQELYSAPRSQNRKHRRTRSSGSMRMQPPHPADMHFAEWPEMHEPFYSMPEPQFSMHPPPFHGMHHPAMGSHMSLPELGMGHEPQQAPPPPPPAQVNAPPPQQAQQAPSVPTPRPNMANDGPMSKDGPRGILRKPSGSLHSMTPQRLPPQSQHGPQHPPFPMQHFGPPPPHMMGPMSHPGPFPSPGGMGHHPHMGFPLPPHGMFPQGAPPPWHGGGQQPMSMQGGPMGPPGSGRPSRKS